MLKNLMNLPLFIFGDYNIDIHDLRNTGFLQAHNLIAVELPGGGTIKNETRKIDFVVCSGTMYTAIVQVKRSTNGAKKREAGKVLTGMFLNQRQRWPWMSLAAEVLE